MDGYGGLELGNTLVGEPVAIAAGGGFPNLCENWSSSKVLRPGSGGSLPVERWAERGNTSSISSLLMTTLKGAGRTLPANGPQSRGEARVPTWIVGRPKRQGKTRSARALELARKPPVEREGCNGPASTRAGRANTRVSMASKKCQPAQLRPTPRAHIIDPGHPAPTPCAEDPSCDALPGSRSFCFP